MSDLIAFVSARLDEDEAAAKAARGDADWTWRGIGRALDERPSVADTVHIARHDPARVLREVDAKRKIIGEQSDHAPIESIYGTTCRTCVNWQDAPLAEGGETEFGIAVPQDWPCRVARSAIAAWSDHPDYDPAWA